MPRIIAHADIPVVSNVRVNFEIDASGTSQQVANVVKERVNTLLADLIKPITVDTVLNGADIPGIETADQAANVAGMSEVVTEIDGTESESETTTAESEPEPEKPRRGRKPKAEPIAEDAAEKTLKDIPVDPAAVTGDIPGNPAEPLKAPFTPIIGTVWKSTDENSDLLIRVDHIEPVGYLNRIAIQTKTLVNGAELNPENATFYVGDGFAEWRDNWIEADEPIVKIEASEASDQDAPNKPEVTETAEVTQTDLDDLNAVFDAVDAVDAIEESENNSDDAPESEPESASTWNAIINSGIRTIRLNGSPRDLTIESVDESGESVTLSDHSKVTKEFLDSMYTPVMPVAEIPAVVEESSAAPPVHSTTGALSQQVYPGCKIRRKNPTDEKSNVVMEVITTMTDQGVQHTDGWISWDALNAFYEMAE